MTAAGSVTADALIRALARRNATLPAEIATFLVLEGCDVMLESGPRELADLSHVRISEQGTVSLSGPASDDARGARDLHRLFTRLLADAGHAVSPALMQLAEHGPRGGDFSLRALRDELEAALVPLNRNASRRVLARFARESAQPVIEPHEVDAALSSLLRGAAPANDAPASTGRGRESTPALPPPPIDPFQGSDLAREESRLLDSAVGVPGREPAQRGSIAPEPRTRSLRPSFAPHASERESLQSLRPRADDLEEVEAAPPGSRRLLVGLAVLALGIAGVGVGVALRSADGEQATEGTALVDALERGLTGDLVVRVSVPDAQILRYVGSAPVTVGPLPVSTAHEFVATAPGHAPARVLVPADADWDATEQGARYEAALQLREQAQEEGDAGMLELGPSRLAGPLRSDGQPDEGRGSVRVVASPRGARVYQLVGFSPELHLEDVPRSIAQELLIYREGYVPALHTVATSDFQPAGERHVAEVSVTLAKR